MCAYPAAPPTTLDEIPGWFPGIDQRLFDWFLEQQERSGITGDLLELGVYLGKSAVHIGCHQHGGEIFTVCDLFGCEPPDEANAEEMRASYPNLTRAVFERNYLAFHDRLPNIIAGPTTLVPDHVKPGSCRFVHVDASHLYEHVKGDIAAARAVLRPGGIVVCDDYRSEHTPGVAAAVWEAVMELGLHPVCITPQKMYGTWDDSSLIQKDLLTWLGDRADGWHEVQEVRGRPLVRVRETPPPQSPAELRAELARVKAELARAKPALKREQQARENSERWLNDIRGSASYRVGRVLTAVPRSLRSRLRDTH